MKGTAIIFVAALTAALGWVAGRYSATRSSDEAPFNTDSRITVYDTVTVRLPPDTITVTAPPVSVTPLPRYVIARLPRIGCGTDTIRDTVTVTVPVSRYEYTDTLCHIIASGFAIRFDTVSIYAPRQLRTVTLMQTRPARWGIGLGVGAAVTPHGVQPALCLTVSRLLWSR